MIATKTPKEMARREAWLNITGVSHELAEEEMNDTLVERFVTMLTDAEDHSEVSRIFLREIIPAGKTVMNMVLTEIKELEDCGCGKNHIREVIDSLIN